MGKLGAILACVVLAGCSTTPPPLDVKVECVPLRTWPPAEQAALALALGPVPADSTIWTMAKDWEQMRAAIRACNTPHP